MTGREGETFPGFFYGRRGQPDAGVREVRSSQEEGDGLECRHWEFAAIYGAGRGIWQGAPTAVLWRCIGGARKGRAVDALRGPHSGVACSGTFWEGSMLLEKMQTFFCVFPVC